MLAVISAIIGLISSTIPSVIRYFERKQEIRYELEITQLKIQAAEHGFEVAERVAGVNAQVSETNNARDHDDNLDGGTFINQLRASVRPVITYTFFGLWLFVKLIVLFTLLRAAELNLAVFVGTMLDEQTLALFGLVMGFWFGSRSLEKKLPLSTVPSNKLLKSLTSN